MDFQHLLYHHWNLFEISRNSFEQHKPQKMSTIPPTIWPLDRLMDAWNTSTTCDSLKELKLRNTHQEAFGTSSSTVNIVVNDIKLDDSWEPSPSSRPHGTSSNTPWKVPWNSLNYVWKFFKDPVITKISWRKTPDSSSSLKNILKMFETTGPLKPQLRIGPWRLEYDECNLLLNCLQWRLGVFLNDRHWPVWQTSTFS